MKNKILKIVVYLAGFLAFLFFCIAIFFKEYPRAILSKTSAEAAYYTSADFGYHTCLQRPNSDINSSDLFILGDSFVPHFDELVENETGLDVFSMFSHELLKNGRKVESLFNHTNFAKLLPAYHFNKKSNKPKETKKLIMVLAERTLYDRFVKRRPVHQASVVDTNRRKLYNISVDDLLKLHGISKDKSGPSIAGLKFKRIVNPLKLNYKDRAERYGFLWARSFVTFRISQTLKRIQKFIWGDIVKLDVIKKRSWHFAEKSLINLSDAPERSNKTIEKLVSNFAKIKKSLLKDYNLELVLMPVPDKISIYGDQFFNDKYNQFIPRLNKSLKEAGIETIGLYEAFKKHEEILYFENDQHWNKTGLELAISILKKNLNL